MKTKTHVGLRPINGTPPQQLRHLILALESPLTAPYLHPNRPHLRLWLPTRKCLSGRVQPLSPEGLALPARMAARVISSPHPDPAWPR